MTARLKGALRISRPHGQTAGRRGEQVRIFSQQRGFTLIESIAVIALSILVGAYVTPKLINLKPHAQVAVLDGIHGAMVSSLQQINMKARIAGVEKERNAVINLNGQTVRLRYGYPRTNQMFYRNANNPGVVDVNIHDAQITGNIVRLESDNNCRIRYRQPTASGQPPRIDTRNCGVA